MYSLMPTGLHVENGLDPETSLHLYQRVCFIEVLDKLNKHNLKHIVTPNHNDN